MSTELRRTFGLIRRDAGQKNSFPAIFSTSALDVYGDVVEQEWDLSRFNTNPVVLFEHDTSTPIGKASDVVALSDRLVGTINLASTPKAQEVAELIRSDVLRGVSVGFIPGSVDVREGVVRLTGPHELCEVSICSIPANAEALLQKSLARQLQRAGHRDITPTKAAPAVVQPAQPAWRIEGERKAAERREIDERRALIKKGRADGTLAPQLIGWAASTPSESLRKYLSAVAATPSPARDLAKRVPGAPPLEDAPPRREGERWEEFSRAQLTLLAATDRARFDELYRNRAGKR